MSKPARLLFSLQRFQAEAPTSNVDVIAECPTGIPIGWIFCFGGRNIWEPDDHIEDRGGSSALRNRYETPVEVAEARMSNVVGAVQSSPHLWVWLSSLQLLQRRLSNRGKKGFIRVDANWAFKQEKSREKIVILTAQAENIVNLILMGRIREVPNVLPSFDPFCPFVPHIEEKDAKRFAKAKGFENLDGARRAAALTVGLPPRDQERFLTQVDEVCQPEYEKLSSLPPYPMAAPATKVDDDGLLGKVKGLFRRG
ncbi:hypothetical protein KQI84_07445 [bacterium]|nr:hypothetical protein [bacterium]